MRVAALDLGTNTFILLVAEVEDGRVVQVLRDDVRVVRLGQGVHESKRFHPDALKRAEECFAEFSEIIRSLKAERVLACATSAARDVQNANELFELGKRFGIPIEVISGDQEAEYTFSGTVGDGLTGPAVIIDVGGGSTEFIAGDQSGLLSRSSVDVGSVRLTELFITGHPIVESEMSKLSQYIKAKISGAISNLPKLDSPKVIAVAGTPTTLATIDQGLPFETERVHGYKLPQEKISSWIDNMSAMTVVERQKLAGMEPKRADVIVAGALILKHASELLSATHLEVSILGLRYGVARALAKR